jgi:hypothetical protein
MIKTGKFKMFKELVQDLWVSKHFDFDGKTPPYGFKELETPLDFNVNEELEALKQDAIKSIVGKGKLISVTSERKCGVADFIPYEEFTVTYEG